MNYKRNRTDPSDASKVYDDLLSDAPPAGNTSASSVGGHAVSEVRFRQFLEINRQISQKENLSEILEKVMESAILLTGAERGFLLLKSGQAKTKILDGFEIKTSKGINKQSMEKKEFKISLTAVKLAIEQGNYLLTNNAMLDTRLRGKKSVVQYNLKSILVIPIELGGKIFGALYLDHHEQANIFSDEVLLLLFGFASQVALIIQKAQMIEQLKDNNISLEKEVQNQAEKIELLTDELSQMRSSLKYDYREIIGQSSSMMEVFRLLDHVTDTSIPVWIWGESGTGKELIARSLHYNSPRKEGPFISENCSAIPETILESELFGHKKGAFTHADRDRIGLFQQADQGTLFLDEIGDMSLGMQAKILRVLQEGEIRPLGSNTKIKINIRLVTASNRNLNEMVKDGKFRQDLFFRINGLTIKLPPLRERKEDIPLLIEYFIKKITRTYNLPPAIIREDALKFLMQHTWPGNIRELEGIIRNAMLFAKGKTINQEHLPVFADFQVNTDGKKKKQGVSEKSEESDEKDEERRIIIKALKRHKLNKGKAAKEIGICLKTFYSRMSQLGIPKKKQVLVNFLASYP